MKAEPKVTECWMDYDDDGCPSVFEERSNFSKSRHDHYKQAIILWREDYDALTKELAELREHYDRLKKLGLEAISLVYPRHNLIAAEAHDDQAPT